MITALCVDTSTNDLVVGIVRLDPASPTAEVSTLAETTERGLRSHNEHLVPLTLAALDAAGLTFADLDAVIVGVGPGPFTGLRVGMASAEAFGQACGIPVYGVVSLDAVRWAFQQAGGDLSGSLLVASDARRKEVYWARYVDGDRVAGPHVDKPAVLADLDEPVHQWVSPIELPVPGVRVEAQITAAALAAAAGDVSAPPAPLQPLYLRRPDAVVPTPQPVSPALVARSDALRIRALSPADAAACAELEAVLFAGESPWTQTQLTGEIAAPTTLAIGAFTADPARAEDRLVGYAILGVTGDYEVHTIGVAPDSQGHGIGRRLLRELLAAADAQAEPVFLEVRVGNEAAIGLYESEGFERIGLRRNYYQPSGADAVTMVRPSVLRKDLGQ
ncbi:MAG: tRNA (adenosine(37)-N6)-threonylcarbamoyltransferase complex dimerization subunit type 1 TsaB [Corynebacterium sp.]|nr:tRNA (adenosine(37)-N6)-threonylcarbamoyltransferase complex dimerization subunit type 1 TsaB [Corynebacterium sp.]